MRRTPRALLRLFVSLLMVAGLVVAAPTPAFAGRGGGGPKPTPPPSPTTFTRVFSTQENGSIRMFGNSNMTCAASAKCTDAQAGTAGMALSDYNNNAYVMEWIDLDGDPATVNSTSADLAIPEGSTILRAQLIWGGNDGSNVVGSRTSVNMRVNGGAYTPVTAEAYPGQQASPLWAESGFYQASADVTSFVAANPTGTYWVADIASVPNVSNKFAGWALIVAYRNPGDPLRDLTINLGLDQISGSGNTQITIDGFLTPTSGAVNASVGVVAWEGDLGIVGDEAALQGTALSNENHPTTNFFDSSVSDPTVAAARNPDYVNGMGVDVARVDASNIIANGATSAVLALSTSGDAYAPGAVTTQVDLMAPAFASITKSVVNLNGHDPAWPGDMLEYRVSLANTGGDSATNAVLSDAIPAGTTYVPGSIVYLPSTATPTEVAMTDAAGDDPAEYDAASGSIVARVGSGATATDGGTVAPLDSAAVRFRVTVDAETAGTSVENAATLSYVAPGINKPFTYLTNSVTTTTAAVADVKVTKTTLGNPATDNPVQFEVVVTNNGPATATAVNLTDRVASPTFSPTGTPITGMSLTADPVSVPAVTCTRTTLTGPAISPDPNPVVYYPGFSCDIGSLAAGESVTVTYSATAYGTTGARVGNLSIVTAAEADPVSVNNYAETSTPRPAATDLWNRGGPNPGQWNGLVTAGKPFLFQMEAVTLDYQGYATASQVVVTLELPVGFTYVPGSSSQFPCTVTGQLLQCTRGNVAPGPAPGVNWTVSLLPDPSLTPGSYPYVSKATTSTPDVNLANNTISGNFELVAAGFPSYQHDIAVTMQAAGDAVAGGTAQVVTEVVNQGPSTAYDVTYTQPTPTGWVVDTISTTNGTCELVNGDVFCRFAQLVPDAPVDIGVTYLVPPDATGPVAISGSATSAETYGQVDTDLVNNDASVSLPIVREADLALVKTQDTYNFAWGDPLQFTLTVTNAGPSTAATGNVITDTLPAGLSFSSGPPECAESTPGVVTCALPDDLAPGSSTSVTFTVATTDPGTPGPVINTAAVTSDTTDPISGNNTPATTVSTASASSDLSLTKSVSDLTPTPGVPFSYTLAVTNNGPSIAAGWSVSDTLPTGVTYDGLNPQCTTTGPGAPVICTTGADLAVGVTETFVIGVTAAPDLTGAIVNTATATSPDDQSPNNDEASIGADLAPVADLQMSLVVPAGGDAGGSFSGTLTVTNAGPSDAASPEVVVQLPSGFTLDAATGAPAGVSCAQTGSTVRCTLPSLAPSVPLVIPVTLDVASSVVPASYDLAASVATGTAESDFTNNTTSATFLVGNTVDLSLTKAGPASPLEAGGVARYVISLTNAGPSDTLASSTGYVVSDTFAAGLTVLAVSMPGATCSVVTQTASCTLSRVPAGATVDMTVVVVVGYDVDLAGVDNVANVTNTGGSGDLDLPSNTVNTPVSPSSRLWVTKSTDGALVAAGDGVTYTMIVGNDGPSTAPGVELTDILPDGMTVLGAGVSTDTGTCSGADGATTVTCSLGDLPAGAQANISIQARIPANATNGAGIVNVVRVSDTRGDTEAENSATVQVIESADVSVVKHAATDIPVAGLEMKYVISAVNHGPSPARAVVVTDALPAGTSLVAAETAIGSCAEAAGVVSCSLGDLANGQVATIALTVLVDSSLGATTLTNTASVGSDSYDPLTDDNAASVSQEVQALSIFAMTKEVTSGLTDGVVMPGSEVTYTITATNQGPSDAVNAWIMDRIPVDGDGNELATFVSASIDGDVGTCELILVYDDAADAPPDTVNDQYYRCTYGALAVGQTMTMTFTIGINDDASGALSNWAWGGADNNTLQTGTVAGITETAPYAESQETILVLADLAPTVTVPATVMPGTTVAATVAVQNNGPMDAAAPFVDIELPAGTSFESVDGATCQPIVTGLRCSLAELPVEASNSFVLYLATDPAATGSGAITVVAGSGATDPVTSNNAATASFTWVPDARLAIVASASTPTATPGQSVTYTLKIGNIGQSTGTDVVVTATIPDGVTIDPSSISIDDGVCAVVERTLRCSFATLAPDAWPLVTFSGRIADAMAPGHVMTLGATATMTGATMVSASVDVMVMATPTLPFTGGQSLLLLVAGAVALVGGWLLWRHRRQRHAA